MTQIEPNRGCVGRGLLNHGAKRLLCGRFARS
jgi:hypothetical protein